MLPELRDEPSDDWAKDEASIFFPSNIAIQWRDKVPRGAHVKGTIPYPEHLPERTLWFVTYFLVFWVNDEELVSQSTIQTQIQRKLAINHGVSANDRRVALQVARTLQSQLFDLSRMGKTHIAGWHWRYMFLNDLEGGSEMILECEESTIGVITMLTRCCFPSCGEGIPCYSYSCPRKVCFDLF